MGTSEIKISQGPEALSRPSLLSTGAPSADHNILDAMAGRSERAEATPRPRRLWWWLLLPLAATAWGISTQLAQPPAMRPVQTAATQPVSEAPATVEPAAVVTVSTSTSTPLAATAVAAATPNASPDPFQSLAAAPAVAPGQPASSAPANPVTRLQATMDTPAAAPAPTTRGAEKTTAPAKAKAVRPAATPSAGTSSTTAARKTPAPKTAAQAGVTQKTPAKATASAKEGSRDPDVELLNAIMKHLGNGKGSEVTAAPPRSPQTIAELVKSCRTKDAIEALLCQRRICEGSWGKAQACPREQAPNAVKTASPT